MRLRRKELEKEEKEVDKTLQSDPPILPIAVFLSNTYWKKVEEDQRNPFNQILPLAHCETFLLMLRMDGLRQLPSGLDGFTSVKEMFLLI